MGVIKPAKAVSVKPEISVAPMLDWTDRHCRYFHRLLSPHARLYSEMITTGALLHGDADRHLRFDAAEHPVALQLGGSDPDALARCAELGQTYGYDEINLNCGCPSDRVQNGAFGACLMQEPDLVASCVEAMQRRVDIPVTIKCRIGIDAHDGFDFLRAFVDKSVDKGITTFIIHARKAWLKGLSPKENRDIPPLDYARAARVKEIYPQLRIILNGGLTNAAQIAALVGQFDGFMLGREAYSNPCILTTLEQEILGEEITLECDLIAETMARYAQEQFTRYGTPVKSITRHILGLYHGQPGARSWKRFISENAHKDGADHSVILQALQAVQHERIRHSHSARSH